MVTFLSVLTCKVTVDSGVLGVAMLQVTLGPFRSASAPRISLTPVNNDRKGARRRAHDVYSDHYVYLSNLSSN